MCRYWLTLLLGILFMAQLSSAQMDVRAMERALQSYVESYSGGLDADALSSISIEGTQVHDGLSYDFQLRRKSPNFIRYRLSDGESSVVSAYDGRRGWLQKIVSGKTQVQLLTGGPLQMLQREAVFECPLIREFRAFSKSIEMGGRGRVGNRDVFIFQVPEAHGSRKYYLDTVNSHILQRDLIDAAGAVTLRTIYRDYRQVKGFPFAFEIENEIGGQLVSTTKIDSIVVNAGILSFYFAMPLTID